MTKAIVKTYSFTREYSAILTYFFLAGSILMAVAYSYNIYAIISKTVAVKNMETQIAKIQSSVQQLDAEYIALSSKITPDMAEHYGLEQATVSAYVPRTPSFGSAIGLNRGL